MKRSRNNIISCIILVLGLLLFVDVCVQQKDTSLLTELNAENTPSLDAVDPDLDLTEEHQITFSIELLAVVEKLTVHNHFHFTNRSVRPCFSVWQPPELS
ncbi:hypothetical protein [Flavobacterium sp. TAB 87]|uniref:hypothetical protein n=1 Tax=Flavobacterium sp. TAB 87 TaxID=1729581 RepID=UPI00076C7DC3|nr:hypothetical protein [Flavobacterium sp. TAB 87]KVV14046.1 hypothetical protein AP058_01931 [Flavobacterium sp. TAB 87]